MERESPQLLPHRRLRVRRGVLLAVTMLALMTSVTALQAQGLVQGVEQGSRAGRRAAGPVGGVLGGAIGGVVGVVGGVLGAGQQAMPAQPSASPAAPEPSKPAAKPGKKTALRDQKGVGAPPQLAPVSLSDLSPEQIIASVDANVARLKDELKLSPEQEKNWGAFNNAMHNLGLNGAERVKLRVARAQRDPPDDIVDQMRNEAQFLADRAQDQRVVADAVDPLFLSLDDRQKSIFIAEMVRLSRERGLD
jgi:hypothetical protein